MSKLVLSDSGLTAHLLGLSSRRFIGSPTGQPGLGSPFGAFIITELLKATAWADQAVKAFHWRDRSGREVDLLLERRDGSLIGIEVKLGDSIGESDFAPLEFLRDRLGDRFCGGAVINTWTRILPFGDRLWSCPESSLRDPA